MKDYADRVSRERRRAWASRPKPIKDVVADVMNRRGYGQCLTQAVLHNAWREAVETTLGVEGGVDAFCVPTQLRRGKLQIAVRHSAWLQELSFHKQALLGRLREALPAENITDLRFRVGSL
jgi:predicted nucleic acid-binding Zn ribbon protein